MNPQPTCMTCVHWHVIDRGDGWCTKWDGVSSRHFTCDKHVPVKIEPIDKLTDQTKDKLKNPPQPVDKEEWFG